MLDTPQGVHPPRALPLPPRYRGSFWRALSACFPPRWHLALLLVGGSAYLDLQQGERLSPRLALTCLCHLLVLALGLQVRHRHPAPARAPRGCSAHGVGCLALYLQYSHLHTALLREGQILPVFSAGGPRAPAVSESSRPVARAPAPHSQGPAGMTNGGYACQLMQFLVERAAHKVCKGLTHHQNAVSAELRVPLQWWSR